MHRPAKKSLAKTARADSVALASAISYLHSFIDVGRGSTFGGWEGGGGGGVLPCMGYIGMCRCEGYGFQAVYSGIGYINQRV